jgi:type I restriction enzyme, R subunit
MKSGLRADPRALIQMATGSGKTFTAVNVAYRLLKFANAKRILFLVDRGNLGKQTEDEFANFEPPEDPRKFPTLYTLQRLTTNSINPAAKVVITMIQRLYSMLKGEVEFDACNEEGSAFDTAKPWQGAPPDVAHNAGISPEFFDFIIVDECHRPFTNSGPRCCSISTRCRARLATSSNLTGSPPTANTIGITRVAAFAALLGIPHVFW